jgi:hypothetical protein
MQIRVAKQLIRIWPLPPKFQNFILKAGRRAKPTINNKEAVWTKIQNLRSVEKMPSNRSGMTLKGLLPVVRPSNKQARSKPTRIAPKR